MEKQGINHRRSTLLIGGIAAILVSGIAVGSLAIPVQGPNGVVAPAERPEAAAARANAARGARAYGCAECGVIESTREVGVSDEETGVGAPGRMAEGGGIEGKPVRNYEITVRMQNGAMRVLTDTDTARWRLGERVMILAGVNY
ncbi:MAG: hypothetical protein HY661_01960 [Betaproteobacteria bacterium]|nr:hypothetical protein [Betaproteobacteria bacterium]